MPRAVGEFEAYKRCCMQSLPKLPSTSASSAIFLTVFTPSMNEQTWKNDENQRQVWKSTSSKGIHFEKSHIPATILDFLQRSNCYWYLPHMNFSRVGVEGEEHQVEMCIVNRYARLAVRIDIHE